MHKRDVLKVDFFPETIVFPTFTRDAYLKQTAEDMLHLLQQGESDSSLIHDPLSFGPPILNAYAKIAEILRRALQPPPPTSPEVVETPAAILPRVPPVPIVSPPPAALPPPLLAPAVLPPHVLVPLPRVQVPQPAKVVSPSLALLRKSPRARFFSRLRFDPRTHQRTPLAQSIQHDPTIAGTMYHPDTGKVENIDSLLRVPDSLIWYRSLSNEWGRCTQGLPKSHTISEHIAGHDTMVFISPMRISSAPCALEKPKPTVSA